MNQLLNWAGKTDEITISYDTELFHNNRALGATNAEYALPAIQNSENEIIRKLTNVVW